MLPWTSARSSPGTVCGYGLAAKVQPLPDLRRGVRRVLAVGEELQVRVLVQQDREAAGQVLQVGAYLGDVLGELDEVVGGHPGDELVRVVLDRPVRRLFHEAHE